MPLIAIACVAVPSAIAAAYLVAVRLSRPDQSPPGEESEWQWEEGSGMQRGRWVRVKRPPGE